MYLALQQHGKLTFMITTNDKIQISMRLFEAHYLRSILNVYQLENPTQKVSITRLINNIDDALNSLDLSENEKLIDKTNKEIAKQA